MYPIFAYGSEEQKREWLPKLASGEAIVAAGEAVDAFYQLHTGAAAMQMDGESVHDYAPGAFFGAPFPEHCRLLFVAVG